MSLFDAFKKKREVAKNNQPELDQKTVSVSKLIADAKKDNIFVQSYNSLTSDQKSKFFSGVICSESTFSTLLLKCA